MSAPPAPSDRLPSEDEVRSVVAAILAEMTAGDPVVETGTPFAGVPETTVSAEVAIGADHGGYRLKERIVADLRERGYEVHDCGTDSTEPVDYPDFAHAVGRLVADGRCRFGIVVDGAGIGSCIAANKVPGVRAATCWDISSAKNSREHNHANVLALGAGLVGETLALEIVRAWILMPWGADRHARRVSKITDIEQQYLASAETGATA
jgi:RpiB/LacA/LacB family sugar-phosphate isomerase